MALEEPGERTFMRITNKEIYNEIKAAHVKLDKIGNSVIWHKRWLTGTTAAVMAIIGWILGKP